MDGTVDIYAENAQQRVTDYLNQNAISNEEIIKNAPSSEKLSPPLIAIH